MTNTTNITFDSYTNVDWVLVITSSVLLFLYQLFYIYELIRLPLSTSLGSNQHIRKKWIKKVAAEERLSIIAIQTIRNTVLTCTLLASASAAIVTFSVASSLDFYEDGHYVRSVQYLVLAALIGSSFLNMVCVIFI
eukprot:TRINITY_DN696_c1_g1_i1.p1 TRINITY_DN696_c1_g1~~TRINITY_DN696_c1_g1_i1.p1  ORF type:complete len:136 (-),score=12.07 TRINITY_DN696_c1_g1_i1:434-841(-)